MCLFRFLENFINYEEVEFLLDVILVIFGFFYVFVVGIYVLRMVVLGFGLSYFLLLLSLVLVVVVRYGVSFLGLMINFYGFFGVVLSFVVR